MKAEMVKAKKAMIEAGLPSKLKSDNETPNYYLADSWRSKSDCPWNVDAKRAMTPAEGIAHLSAELVQVKAQLSEARSNKRR